MRTLRTVALAAGTALGAGMAVAAAGRYAAGAALKPARRGQAPVPPGFGSRVTVHAGGDPEAGRIELRGSPAAALPGTYALAGRRCRAVVGPVLEERPHGSAPRTLLRRLDRVTGSPPGPGARLRLVPAVHTGDPRDALGLAFRDVEISGELGSLPAWFIPGDRTTWVIAVHGLGAGREQALTVLPALERLSIPVLVPAHRGDPGAPALPGGLGHLGAREWHDLDAAMRYAVRHGAERLLLQGWSTGATMVLRAAGGAAERHRVGGLVLDSPVLDSRATFRALAAARRTPRALLPLAVRAAEGRTGLDPARFAADADPRRSGVPCLIVHGPDDTVAPWAPSRAAAGERPDLITLHTVPGAQHAAMWNADPHGYEEALRRFLTPLL